MYSFKWKSYKIYKVFSLIRIFSCRLKDQFKSMFLLNLHFKRLGKCISKIINSHKTLMLILKEMMPVKDKYI